MEARMNKEKKMEKERRRRIGGKGIVKSIWKGQRTEQGKGKGKRR